MIFLNSDSQVYCNYEAMPLDHSNILKFKDLFKEIIAETIQV